jgi:cell division septal protein FtsQ
VNPLEAIVREARVLPFRRPPAAVRVRRRNPWLALLLPGARVLVAVGVPVALALWLTSSPTFALARLEVAGNRHVERAWIEEALAPVAGENVLRLSLPAIEQRVRANPWVAEVRLEKRLPNALRLTIVERRPAALLRSGTGFQILDERGRPVVPWKPGLDGPGLLLVSVGASTDVDLAGALAIADELRRVAPEWSAGLSEVEALSEDEFRLYLAALPFPLVVRAGTLGERLPLLRPLLPELARRYAGVRSVDLRFAQRIVFQPLVERS